MEQMQILTETGMDSMQLKSTVGHSPAICTVSNFARGLTGVIDDDGTRTYLHPRMSDTDGDGMPDGYEVWMCEQYSGYNPWTMQFECPRFNPLNSKILN